MLQDQLPNVRAGKGSTPGQQFLVNNGQAILIAKSADVAIERFWSRVHGGDATRHGSNHALQVFDKPEVRDLDVAVNEKKILRLDVEVLQLVVLIHQVERFGGLFHVAKQLFARYARKTRVTALTKTVP